MADVGVIGAERVAAVMSPQGEFLGLPKLQPDQALAVTRKRAGRPVGARNRRAEEVAAFVIRRLGDPLLHQAAIATMDVVELAARRGCSALEAGQEKRLAAMVVLPYLHRRKPLAVDLTNHRVVHLTITDGGAASAPDHEQNQMVVEVVDAPV